MIPKNEIREHGRKHGVPFSTIERDYVQNWLLKYMAGIDRMILKGGTAIRKAYLRNYRFSDDLDFTLIKEMDIDELKISIGDIVEKCKAESEITFMDGLNVSENVNGFKLDIYFQISQKGTDRTKIKLDITKPDHEEILLPVKEREIIHLYSDNVKGKVTVYSLEEIIAEKIRSIFQRTRPRDLYDLWYLWDRTDTQKAIDILPEKFRMKSVKPVLTDLKRRKDDFRNAWVNSLRHQLRDLPNFDEVYENIEKKMEEIWIE